MRVEALRYLCCPACHGDLAAKQIDGEEVGQGNLVCSGCRGAFPLRYGLPQLRWPPILPEPDAREMAHFDLRASTYDRQMRAGARFLGISERLERQSLVDRLRLRPGDAVLEVSVGTGSNARPTADRAGQGGVLFGLDISEGMLRRCRAKLRRQRIAMHLCAGNASYLPFRDSVFNAVFHFSGINSFGEPARVIQEMVRVARPDARIVITDEGLSPQTRDTDLGRRLIEANRIYTSEPPLHLLPDRGLKERRLDWAVYGAMWVLELTKA